MQMKTKALAAALACSTSVVAQGGTFMDAAWATQMCKAWNSDAGLTKDLGGDAWAKNDAGRGYKVIHLYRTKCGEKSAVELEIVNKDGKAMCNYGGALKHTTLNFDVDYVMSSDDEGWTCMGEGKFGCGAMGAMMSGTLKFKGPKGEAMGVMGPFDGFLQLTGKVPGDKAACP